MEPGRGDVGQTALTLIERGHEVGVSHKWWPETPSRLAEISHAGGLVFWRDRPTATQELSRREKEARDWRRADPFGAWCDDFAPGLVHVKDGQKFIGNMSVILACQHRRIPYVINLRGLDGSAWIEEGPRTRLRDAFLRAKAVFLLSQDNLDILETQLGASVPQARIVDNAFGVTADARPAWPGDDEPWRIACVARLNMRHKGQDLILKMLAQPWWRTRPIKISFWGTDKGSRQHMLDLIEMYGIGNQVEFRGFSDDITDVWREHHALLLPSRFEGNSRAVMEAIVCGRVPIVTKVGRNAEVVDDNETGFLVAAPTVELVDQAMDRAWSRRHDWQAMGERGAGLVRRRFSMTPVADYATLLEEVATGVAGR